jgi:hypothetical protein
VCFENSNLLECQASSSELIRIAVNGLIIFRFHEKGRERFVSLNSFLFFFFFWVVTIKKLALKLE